MLLIFAALCLFLLAFGPNEPVETETHFDRRLLGDGVDAYLAAQEARFDDIRPGQEKRVVWRGLEEVPTDLSLVYVHGFSASSEEIRPVADALADTLSANLIYMRLTGHGRDSEAMGEARASDWMLDLAEALAVGREVGHEVVVIATSTGASIVTAAATDDEMMREVKGLVLISPNYGVKSPLAPLLTLPAARYWLPYLGGHRYSFEPQNPRHARFWTAEYPSTALFPMAAIAQYAADLDHDRIGLPVLFYYSDEDKIVDAAKTDDVVARWGGPVTRAAPDLGAGVDPNAHVIAGDILSPANTQAATDLILEWIRGL